MQKFQQNNPIHAINLALKFDPPTIALYYKRHINSNKKYMYNIELNSLIDLKDPIKITQKLFQEHPLYLNSSIIDFEQVEQLVDKLVQVFYQEFHGMTSDDGEDYFQMTPNMLFAQDEYLGTPPQQRQLQMDYEKNKGRFYKEDKYDQQNQNQPLKKNKLNQLREISKERNSKFDQQEQQFYQQMQKQQFNQYWNQQQALQAWN